ncbi:MAG: glycine C-acetyltransferase [Pseudomonadota bacterium]
MTFLASTQARLDAIRTDGLWKSERALTTPQSARIATDGRPMLNLCANNYLGLADHPALIAAACASLDRDGYGMASVRFICGTHDLHRQLEAELAAFLGKDDAILFAACFDANGALFEPLLGPDDAVVSDALNHASIIDGIRLSKARRFRYANRNMSDLETQLKAARAGGARNVMIATDGVFSMDGTLASLAEITALAARYDAAVMVDDCHATGFMGPDGSGTPAHCGVADAVDILTGTLGKALGGAIGGYAAGPQAVIDLLRQTGRPYLFSNALPPMVCAASLEALRLVREEPERRERLHALGRAWRSALSERGFDMPEGEHAIVPVMLGEAHLAQDMAAALDRRGVYVSGFFYPVVPKGTARIRTQMNAALTDADVSFGLDAFTDAAQEVGVL